MQNINTNPENFTWEKDKTVIVTAAPGLYEVTFGFFTKRKPQVIALRVELHTRPHTSDIPPRFPIDQVWRLSSCDLAEIARNSVLHPDFEESVT